jgi:hypothetical protein
MITDSQHVSGLPGAATARHTMTGGASRPAAARQAAAGPVISLACGHFRQWPR